MARIVLEPRFYEIDLFREQYDGLVEELKAAGHDVRVAPEAEQRSSTGAIARTAYDVAIYVLDAEGA